MAPPADVAVAKIGYETDKLLGRQKSFGDSKGTQNLCQYKFYPSYGSTMVVQIKVEDFKCNEAASRSLADNRKEMQIKGVVGQ
ncbi:unnamed protein product [Lupinus luteus]|uniref:Uncharacterized protein n=1 Tax=Lupinus luteus TaxID=3873 RepID=A0AAV1YKE1_LUPLU